MSSAAPRGRNGHARVHAARRPSWPASVLRRASAGGAPPRPSQAPRIPPWLVPGAAIAFNGRGGMVPLAGRCTAVHPSSGLVEIDALPGRFDYRLFDPVPALDPVPPRARQGPLIDRRMAVAFKDELASEAPKKDTPPAGVERLWLDYNVAADELWIDGVKYLAAEFRAFAAALGPEYRNQRVYVYPSLDALPVEARELRERLARCLAELQLWALRCQVCAGSGFSGPDRPCVVCLSTRQLLAKAGAL